MASQSVSWIQGVLGKGVGLAWTECVQRAQLNISCMLRPVLDTCAVVVYLFLCVVIVVAAHVLSQES